MVDFLMIATRSTRRGTIEVYPKFVIKRSSDLMIRGGDFYAIWIEERGLWSQEEQDALYLIDHELDKYAEENAHKFDAIIKVLHLWDAETGMIDNWHKYCQRQTRDSFHMLDEKLIFSNSNVEKKDYASKKLSYPLGPGDFSAYDKLIGTLYSKKERHKIEWAIGSVVCGDSKKLQKFVVLYGAAGTGKSTILNIIQQLFEGYYSVFDAKALGSSNNSFALESFKANPLVSIQHDGDLSKIEDNTRLNSLVSHEMMTVNEKFKSAYANNFKCFLFMGTNKPVKITDAKSGLLRRLIDVSPSGDKLSQKEYKTTVNQVSFELGAIAYHCQEVYLNNINAYDDYVPTMMLGASNDFYNFIIEVYHVFKKEDGTTLKAAWEMYKTYCDDAKVNFPFAQRAFKEELKNYFKEYRERFNFDDGTRVRSYYTGFRVDKFDDEDEEDSVKIPDEVPKPSFLNLERMKSRFDMECADEFAQYATSNDIPSKKWDDVTTKLSEIDTSTVHYVKVPENHIVIDFDIVNKEGEKCLELNLGEASKWPATYAELSKSGAGVHLHYIYAGDVSKLSRVYDEDVEIKVFSGKSSLRRKLTKCNNLPIATISSGLPLKGEDKVVNFDSVKSEKAIRTLIKRNLNKEYHAATTPSVNFIYDTLEKAYASGLHYDVTDMRNSVLSFALNSTNQSDACIKLVNKMQFKSEEISEAVDSDTDKLVFFDVEVFPNLFICCWKLEGPENPVIRMINPTPTEIESILKFKLVGFNNRRYDNHILYARLIGYTNRQLYELSQRIINDDEGGGRKHLFGEAYNLSYTDVYDFASAPNKMSLKKYEIKLGIHHQELGLPWDQLVQESMWTTVADYCCNDVTATEAVFNYLQSDWLARQIMADLAKMTVNDSTNSHTARVVFGKDKHPQSKFNYRDMGDMSDAVNRVEGFDEYTVFNSKGQPVFPGYKFENGKSTYRGEEVGEGGYVYAEQGIYGDVALQDLAGMHPSTIIAEQLFGEEYTRRYEEILIARLAIKHKDYDKARQMLGGLLTKYLVDESKAPDLATALKTVLNAAYGETFAHFENPFKDPRNIDNLVAKRGALFMVNLKHEVQKRGFIVAHIKTDSIKIPDATPEILQFCVDYAKLYKYTFEHECTYERMCLVNDAVYVAKYKDGKKAGQWTATGKQFQVPYVFKTLFTKEPLMLEDMCETMSVKTSMHLDMNESLPDVSNEEKELSKLMSKLLTLAPNDSSGEPIVKRIDQLRPIIETGHAYHFVGRVGQFCPIKPGRGGGELLRESKDKDGNVKYNAVGGSKGYRWLEAEMVKSLNKEEDVDYSYYDRMVDVAEVSISKYGDFNWFVSEKPYETPPYLDGKPIYVPWR